MQPEGRTRINPSHASIAVALVELSGTADVVMSDPDLLLNLRGGWVGEDATREEMEQGARLGQIFDELFEGESRTERGLPE